MVHSSPRFACFPGGWAKGSMHLRQASGHWATSLALQVRFECCPCVANHCVTWPLTVSGINSGRKALVSAEITKGRMQRYWTIVSQDPERNGNGLLFAHSSKKRSFPSDHFKNPRETWKPFSTLSFPLLLTLKFSYFLWSTARLVTHGENSTDKWCRTKTP